ncbi:MAG: CBS domain-containing protein [Gammaproteobacteria bacterium]|nr:CBS domain-containing protein [Gammaproteobacteria bacterium]
MKSLKVSEYMTYQPATFKKDMPIAEAVELFLTKAQIGGPVLDDNKHVIGFLSEQDCLSTMLEATYFGESHTIVADKMRDEVLTVSPEDSILEIAKTMTGQKPKIYPVVDANNILLGIITRRDVLKAIDIHLNAGYAKGHARMV